MSKPEPYPVFHMRDFATEDRRALTQQRQERGLPGALLAVLMCLGMGAAVTLVVGAFVLGLAGIIDLAVQVLR